MSRQRSEHWFAQVPPFSGYPQDLFAVLAGHAHRSILGAGTILGSEGDRAHQFVVVLEGDVSVRIAGREVARLGPGGQIGAAEVLDGTRLPATYVAQSLVTVAIVDVPGYRQVARSLQVA